jgi:hypothetical protein
MTTLVALPADVESAISELSVLAALLDKSGWRAAALIAVSVEPGVGHGGRQTTGSCRLSAKALAKKLNAKGWSYWTIGQYYAAWERAADRGKVKHAADLSFGESIKLPVDGWQEIYSPPPPPKPRLITPPPLPANTNSPGVNAARALGVTSIPAQAPNWVDDEDDDDLILVRLSEASQSLTDLSVEWAITSRIEEEERALDYLEAIEGAVQEIRTIIAKRQS